jgi:uncharacterized damage-inducible protein DinB
MPLNSLLMPEFDQEMANTRKVLVRVPEDRLTWKPHVKSMSLAELATHLASIPGWTTFTLESEFLDMGTPEASQAPKTVSSLQELLALFDKGVTAARTALAAASDECLQAVWSLRTGEQTLFTMPRIAVLRTFILNHGIHHRGQLEVYLRLNDVPLPAIYGPSADEGQM